MKNTKNNQRACNIHNCERIISQKKKKKCVWTLAMLHIRQLSGNQHAHILASSAVRGGEEAWWLGGC